MLMCKDVTIREGEIIIDGYSKNKTEKGALSDLAAEIRKYSQFEADCLLLYGPEWYGDFINIEPVPCATRYDPETGAASYYTANYYCSLRIES